MRSKPLIRKFFAAAAGILLLIIAAIALAPFYVDGSLLRDTLAARLSQFSGGDVKIKGRVRLESFLSLAIEAEDVEVVNVKNLGPIGGIHAGKVTAGVGWGDLIAGRRRFDELAIDGAKITLMPDAEATKSDYNQSFLQSMAALESNPFETIRFTNGSVYSDAALTPLKISRVRFSRSGNGRRLSARGNIVWKDQAMYFRARRGRKTQGAEGLVTPLDLEISGLAMNLNFTGSLGLSPAVALKGDLEFTTPEASALPSWLNLSWTLPETVSAVTAAGGLRWSGGAVVLDNASISINGYEADGSIAMKNREDCPIFEGDLAFRSLDLSGWLTPGAVISPVQPCLKADVRISADRFTAGSFRAGATAAAISVNNSKITANVAELEMFGGVLRGNVEADLSGSTPVWTVRATGQDIDVSRITDTAHMGVWIQGPVNANVELRAQGLTVMEAMKSMNGQAKINFASGGSLGSEMVERLSAITNGSTTLGEIVPSRFSRLRGEFGAVDGMVAARFIEMNGDGSSLTGKGNTDMSNGAVDMRFDIRSAFANASNGGATSSIIAAPAPGSSSQVLSVQGTWANPEIEINGKPVALYGKNSAAPF
ncbi:MAG: AsmA family protein [Chitinophagales bacterium]|nr:AsmA family protein [Hyphomicrobiales bacterium]